MTFLMQRQRFQEIRYRIYQDNKTDFELKAKEDSNTLVKTQKEEHCLTDKTPNPTTRTTNHKFPK